MDNEDELMSPWILTRVGHNSIIRLKIGTTKVGRAPSSDIRLVSKLCSRHHCELNSDENLVTVTDFSSNGVFVNTTAYIHTTKALGVGDRIGFGCEIDDEDCMEEPEQYPIFYLRYNPLPNDFENLENDKTPEVNNNQNEEENEQNNVIINEEVIDNNIAINMQENNKNQNMIRTSNNQKSIPEIIIVSDDSDDGDSDESPKPSTSGYSNLKKDNKTVQNTSVNISRNDGIKEASSNGIENIKTITPNSKNDNRLSHQEDEMKNDSVAGSSNCITNRRKSISEKQNKGNDKNNLTYGSPIITKIDESSSDSGSLVIIRHRKKNINDKRKTVVDESSSDSGSPVSIKPRRKFINGKQKSVVDESSSDSDTSDRIKSRRKYTNNKMDKNIDKDKVASGSSNSIKSIRKPASEKRNKDVDKNNVASSSSSSIKNRRTSMDDKQKKNIDRNSSPSGTPANTKDLRKSIADKQKTDVGETSSNSSSLGCIKDTRKSVDNKHDKNVDRSKIASGSSGRIKNKRKSVGEKQNEVDTSNVALISSSSTKNQRKSIEDIQNKNVDKSSVAVGTPAKVQDRRKSVAVIQKADVDKSDSASSISGRIKNRRKTVGEKQNKDVDKSNPTFDSSKITKDQRKFIDDIQNKNVDKSSVTVGTPAKVQDRRKSVAVIQKADVDKSDSASSISGRIKNRRKTVGEKQNEDVDKSNPTFDSSKITKDQRKFIDDIQNKNVDKSSVTVGTPAKVQDRRKSVAVIQKADVDKSDSASSISGRIKNRRKTVGEKQNEDVDKSNPTFDSSKITKDQRKFIDDIQNKNVDKSSVTVGTPAKVQDRRKSVAVIQKADVDKSDSASGISGRIKNRRKTVGEKQNEVDTSNVALISSSSTKNQRKSIDDIQNKNVDKSSVAVGTPAKVQDRRKSIPAIQKANVDKSDSASSISGRIKNRRKSVGEKQNKDVDKSNPTFDSSKITKDQRKFIDDKQSKDIDKNNEPSGSLAYIKNRRKSTSFDETPFINTKDQNKSNKDKNEMTKESKKTENENHNDDISDDENEESIDMMLSQSLIREIKQEIIDLENEESVIEHDEKKTDDSNEQDAVSPLFPDDYNDDIDDDDEEERNIYKCALKWAQKLSQSQTLVEKNDQKQQSTVIENDKFQKRKVPEIIQAPSLPTKKGKLRGVSAISTIQLKRKLESNLKNVQNKIKCTEQETNLKKKWHQKPSIEASNQKKKNEKLKEERKQKLKELAEEQVIKRKLNENDNDDDDVKIVKRPRVKITYKNRGAFLTEEPSTSKNLPRIPKITRRNSLHSKDEHNVLEQKRTEQELNSSTERRNSESGINNFTTENRTDNEVSAEHINSILKKSNSQRKQLNLRVHFDENSPHIKYIPNEKKSNIEMKMNSKIKDAPAPNTLNDILKLNDKNEAKNLYRINREKRINQMPIIVDHSDEILSEVLNWNPNWLDTHKHEIIGMNQKLLPILHNFSSFDEFKRILFPLMKLELWASIEQEYMNHQSNPFEDVKLLDSSFEHKDKTMTFMCLHRINNASKKIIFNNGDLCLMKIDNHKYFAYIRRFYKKTSYYNDGIHYEILLETTNNSNILTSLNNKNNRIQLKSITLIKIELRSFNAIFSLKYSPLLKNIINPFENIKIKDYKTDTIRYKGCDSLNDNQKDVLLKTYLRIIDYDNPNISLIEGPPGTGKSRLITNLALQLLYGSEVSQLNTKILICSQSNTAIDVICLKLLEIRGNMSSQSYKFRLLRFGSFERMHLGVRSISGQRLVEKYIKNLQETQNERESLKAEKLFLESKIADLKKSNLHDNVNSDKLQETMKRLNAIERLQNNQISNENEAKYYEILIKGAHIVCTTLSSAIKLLQYTRYFDVCIIDEATQCTELLSLIPLQFGISSLVLVGDTQQLPATVLSKEANECGLGRSLFTRIQNCIEGQNNDCLLKLTEQYRMHPDISYWPNLYFYNGRLKDSEMTLTKNFNMKPYTILNLNYNQNSNNRNGQIYNTSEAKFVVNLIKNLTTLLSLKQHQIGIITPYSKHRDNLYTAIREAGLSEVMVNTIDSYQGKEKDVIIISIARTKGIGFLAHPQRLNVALTRAKKGLILCGNFSNVERIPAWKSLLDDAKRRNVFYNIFDNDANDVENKVIPLIKL